MLRACIPRKSRKGAETVSPTIVFLRTAIARGPSIGLMLTWLALAPAGGGCVQVDGGAIEASWVLRTFDGRAISDCGCASPEIARVRFVARPVGADEAQGEDVCAGRTGCEFSCRSQRGATPFFVPAGRYAVSFAALDAQGTPLPAGTPEAAGVRVPAPILREVVHGRPTQLDAVAIETGCAQSCNGDFSNKVCSRN
jgi:hypothetical protein